MTSNDAIAFDDRARAFVQARELIEQAQDTREEWAAAVLEERDTPDELPAEYWAAIAEANVLAQLAKADPAVGFLAGAHMVQRKERRSRRHIREDVFAKLAEVRARTEAPAEAVTTTDRSVEGFAPAPWHQGHTVKLTAGDWAGRTGFVTETHLSENEPTQLSVQLYPPGYPSDPSKPIELIVQDRDVEMVEI